MRNRPQSAKSTQVTEWEEGRRRSVLDELAVEEPLEIRVNCQPAGLTMRTPGDDFELAIGFLFSEGILSSRNDIIGVAYGRHDSGEVLGNRVEVTLAPSASTDLSRLERSTAATASCGVCGRASIEDVRARHLAMPNPRFAVDADFLTTLPQAVRSSQRVFGRTGGLHAAALFCRDQTTFAVAEDIGRHNAVDKVIGKAVLADRVPLSEAILVVSGRGGFEIVQKALVAGIPIVASISAPSSLAVQLARDFNLTLIGFLRGRRFVIYAGDRRIASSAGDSAAPDEVAERPNTA